MKKTVIQCITAILCVALASSALTGGVKKIADAKKEIAESKLGTGEESGADSAMDDFFADFDSGVDTAAPAGDNTAAPAGDNTAAPADDNTAAPAGDNTAAPAGDNTAAPAGDNTAAPKSNAPQSKAEVIKYYNDAINKVISSKAGYTKSRTTDLTKLEGAEAIMKIKIAADAVNDFLGVGTTEYKNAKGKADYLSKAALTEADVKNFSCKESNGTYTIVLELADGASSAPNGSDTSPLQRAGLFVGNTDKSEFDYKNANNIYVGLNNADDASVAAVKEQTSSTKIAVTVNAASGQLTSLKAAWHWDADLTDVKYTIVKISGTGHADTQVSISDFKW